MVSRTTSLLDSLHTTKTVASYSTATEICASALSRKHMSDETDATGERRRRWRLGSVGRASSGRPERPQQQSEIGCKISNLASRRYVPRYPPSTRNH